MLAQMTNRRARPQASLNESRGRVARLLLLFSPILVALVAMLPRLLSAQFGLLDDGVTLLYGQAFPTQWVALLNTAPESGRFCPAFVLFVAVVHTIVGTRPLLFFAVNVVVFAAITAALIGLMRLQGGTRLQAWAAGMFFVLSGASVESFYTLSKAEPLQLMWIVIALLLVGRSARVPGRARSVTLFATATVALLLASATKETTIVLVPISLGWLVVAWRSRGVADGPASAIRARCLLMSVLAAGAFFALRSSLGGLPVAQGGYTRLYRLEWDTLGRSLGDWMILLARDYTYMIPLVVVVVALSLSRGQPQRGLLLDSVVWMIGWMVVYLPWSWTVEYYLLPFTLGAAAFAGVAFGQLVQALTDATERLPRRITAACLVACAVLWPLNLATSASNAAVQLAVDAGNHDLVRFAATLPRDTRLGVNIPGPSEYVLEIDIHLEAIERRPDIVVAHLEPATDAREGGGSASYVAAPRMLNALPLSVRIGVSEAGAAAWDLRLVQALGEKRDLVYGTRRHAQLLVFNLHRPVCRLLGRTNCVAQGVSFIDTRMFSYGWDVYRFSGRKAP